MERKECALSLRLWSGDWLALLKNIPFLCLERIFTGLHSQYVFFWGGEGHFPSAPSLLGIIMRYLIAPSWYSQTWPCHNADMWYATDHEPFFWTSILLSSHCSVHQVRLGSISLSDLISGVDEDCICLCYTVLHLDGRFSSPRRWFCDQTL